MKIIQDFKNQPIRLTTERLAHIEEHPEMKPIMDAIPKVLAVPERVVESTSDPQAHLYYRYLFDTMVGDKYLCVVVKFKHDDAFVLTAYLTDTMKRGVILWPENPRR